LLCRLIERNLDCVRRRFYIALLLMLLVFAVRQPVWGQPAPPALAAFDAYTAKLESRLGQQHRSTADFLAPATSDTVTETARLQSGDPIIERLTPSTGTEVSGSLLHHWRGTAFVPGAKAADFEHVMQDFHAYPERFSPQIVEAKLISRSGDRMQAHMRVRQKHVITVVMDTTYDIIYGRLDAQHGYSISRSTRIREIASPGTPSEHPLNPGEEHGFLWRLNTYWSYEEKDGGLYLQIEAVSLTRSIPHGLAWAIGPYIESIPRESLEFTLRSTCNALRPPQKGHQG
jgi:hypothetical protein